MAKQFENGHFTGKIGAVTGRRIGDDFYLQMSQTTNPSHTPLQQQQRGRMKQLSPLMARLSPVLKTTFAHKARGARTYYSVATSLNMHHAFDEEGVLQMERIVVSDGTLAPLEGLSARCGESRLTLDWTPIHNGTTAKGSDQLMVVVWNSVRQHPRVVERLATREQGHAETPLDEGDDLCWVVVRQGRRWSRSTAVKLVNETTNP